jgi:hypothetical protein
LLKCITSNRDISVFGTTQGTQIGLFVLGRSRSRGRPFKYAINSHVAIGKATVSGAGVPGPEDFRIDGIYAKPMRLTDEMNRNDLGVTIKNKKSGLVAGWRLEPIMKSVPSGLCGTCKSPTVT